MPPAYIAMGNPCRLVRGQLRQEWAARCVVVALIMLTAPPPIGAQSSPAANAATAQRVSATGSVRGQVFDSLTMKPVGNALVWLPGGTQSAAADANGRYDLAGIPTGAQFIAFSSPGLDSLGLGTLGRSVLVQADGTTAAPLTTPSFARLWHLLCSSVKSVGTDSGIVWGTVRDAATYVRQSGASARFNWYDARAGADKKMEFKEITRETRTDSTGTYYACGVPTDMRISSEATGTQSASGVVELLVGERRLLRADLLVSTDMVLQPINHDRTPAESLAALRPRGTSRVTGLVRDNKGKLLSGAVVTLASVDTVIRTNSEGEFTLRELPAGTHLLQVRQIGFAPTATLVDLRPDSSTDVSLSLVTANEIETFNVRATRVAGIDKIGFDERRRVGFGFAFTEKDFKGKTDAAVVLMGLPNIAVSHRDRTGVRVLSGECDLHIFLDGFKSDMQEVLAHPPEYYRAVEIYPRAMSAPVQYGGGSGGCGMVLYWSRHSRW